MTLANAEGNVELADALSSVIDDLVNAAVAVATGGALEILP